MTDPQPSSPVAALVVGDSAVRLWGMTAAQRLRRSLRRAGVAAELAPGQPPQGALLMFRGDWVFDETLVRALADRPGALLQAPDGAILAAHAPAGRAAAAAAAFVRGDPPPGLAPIDAEDLVPAYDPVLRRRAEPLLCPLTRDTLAQLERLTFGASYKGVTDVVTKYAWPAPARAVTRVLAGIGVTPNQVTLLSFGMVLLAWWLFQRGDFMAGLLAAWLMTFLDTVDGKLARVTLTSSRVGGAFDHAIDLIHPPFWWWAWIAGLQAAGPALAHPHLVAAVVVGGYIAMRLQEGLFLALFRLEIHTWKRFDSWFRLITSRRNPNLILLSLGALAGRPDLGMLAVAVWTAASFSVHTVRILQALLARARGPVVSWMAS